MKKIGHFLSLVLASLLPSLACAANKRVVGTGLPD